MNEKKNKHMTLDDRIEIQECLYKRMTFKTIAIILTSDERFMRKNHVRVV